MEKRVRDGAEGTADADSTGDGRRATCAPPHVARPLALSFVSVCSERSACHCETRNPYQNRSAETLCVTPLSAPAPLVSPVMSDA